MIQYKYTKDNNNTIVDIEAIDKKNKSTYFCINCGNELITKLGSKRQHHFAHKSNVINCKFETYLHKLSKEMLYNHLIFCKNKNISFPISIYRDTCIHNNSTYCENCKSQETYNILKYYQKIYLEKFSGDYKPDILLESNNNENKLFIEIVVTHESTEEKKENNKIIEINIDKENDIFEIIKNGISENDKRIQFINFKKTIVKLENCIEENCKNEVGIILLDNNGEIRLVNTKIIIAKNIMNNTNFQKIRLYNNTNLSDFYISFIKDCVKEKLQMRNCFICKNASIQTYTTENKKVSIIKCYKNIKNINIFGNTALKCNYYKEK